MQGAPSPPWTFNRARHLGMVAGWLRYQSSDKAVVDTTAEKGLRGTTSTKEKGLRQRHRHSRAGLTPVPK
ncbi:hypothetical protein F2Q70_00024132 [Brassica cretica]|uniref:Uncharacterized protein n=1 Tax=Brassica cretica TaxID=69181 RepID=A0A8S9GV11_BRACR|nr:hypothetical protein F2Q70_00024132 [Brassica cretica]